MDKITSHKGIATGVLAATLLTAVAVGFAHRSQTARSSWGKAVAKATKRSPLG
jgi:hypothetical protein